MFKVTNLGKCLKITPMVSNIRLISLGNGDFIDLNILVLWANYLINS